MTPSELLRAIVRLLENDKEYQQIMDQVALHEPAFQRICQSLSRSDREELEMYLAACEEAQYHCVYPAYRLGRLDNNRDGK